MSKEIPEDVIAAAIDKFFEGTGFDWRTHNKAGTPRFIKAFGIIAEWARTDDFEQRQKCDAFINYATNLRGNPYLRARDKNT